MEGWIVSCPGHRLPGLQIPDTRPICSPPKTASSPGGDRKAPAAPIRAEKAGSLALTLCHHPAPWFSHRCRSQACPKKPGSQRHGPRGCGKGDIKAEIREGETRTERQRRHREEKRQNETGHKGREKETDRKGEDGKGKRERERETERDRKRGKANCQTETRDKEKQSEGSRQMEKRRSTEKGKDTQRKRRKDRKTAGLEKTDSVADIQPGLKELRSGEVKAGRAQSAIQIESWMYTASA